MGGASVRSTFSVDESRSTILRVGVFHTPLMPLGKDICCRIDEKKEQAASIL